MTSQEYRQLIEAEPFRPFVIHLPSGKEVNVRNPHQAVQLRGGRTVVVASPQHRGAYDLVDLLLVERIEVRDEEPASHDYWLRGNGNGNP